MPLTKRSITSTNFVSFDLNLNYLDVSIHSFEAFADKKPNLTV